MVTFSANSLDFVDDEELRTGAAPDFATRFDSVDSRVEIEDLVNAATAYIPRAVETDLIEGKFAQTVDEGKALADDGNVYDSIQVAENAAASWIRVGPGEFSGRVAIDTPGLTLIGSGDKTELSTTGQSTIEVNADNVTIAELSALPVRGAGIDMDGTVGTRVLNCTVSSNGGGIVMSNGNGSQSVVAGCDVEAADRSIEAMTAALILNNDIAKSRGSGVKVRGHDAVIANNHINGCRDGINSAESDTILFANIIRNCSSRGIQQFNGAGNIIANNRLVNNRTGINDGATATTLDGNLVT